MATLDDYVAERILTADQARILRDAVAQRRNILVSGGTSTGKTTLVNALLLEVAILGRAIAYVVLAVALGAAGITFNIGKYPPGEASNPELPTGTSDLVGELARCKTIGPEEIANNAKFARPSRQYHGATQMNASVIDRFTEVFNRRSRSPQRGGT